ncbi:MAG: hypothetical protein UHL70_08650, partial [Acutalibacteraceae bacterium]|nr:hypothetical protein [Acutalibacteraceae bacterium]
QPVKVVPTSLVAAPSGSENLEISIYNTLPFVKVNPWYFSFFSQKSELHFGNLGSRQSRIKGFKVRKKGL